MNIDNVGAVWINKNSEKEFLSPLYVYRFSWRKRSILKTFLSGSKLKFVKNLKRVPVGSTVLTWGNKIAVQDVINSIRLIRMEDGFLRSVGLGKEFVRPISLVLDTRGIYFDATKPSDLEYFLATFDFFPALIERAQQLREVIVMNGLTKYNVGKHGWIKPIDKQKIILVSGQVESDASLKFGACGGIATNITLLKAVRQANSDAYIIYKPHPDVVAGLCFAGKNATQAINYCDEIITDISMHQLLSEVDEVHVMTSLTGFEALLRNKKVVCYGHPFYAGWGLTQDIYPLERRTKQLTLDQLVAGALILYPTYVSLNTKEFITPEQAIDELLVLQKQTKDLLFWKKKLRIPLRYLARCFKGRL